jgi:hypothetical protein
MKRSDRPARLAVALGAGLASILVAAAAGAYCRTSVCSEGSPHTAAVCVPVQPTDCGTPIAWPVASPCVEFSVQQAGSPKRGITAAQTAQVMTSAFAQWTGAACTGGTPHIEVTEGPEVVCDDHEYNQTAGNANVILYHDDIWPYEGSSNTLALTTVTYDLDTAVIYDADMELNSADNDFTLGDADVDFDLLSIVTHESGHFLGMAHSADPNATMWPVYNEHSTNLREISPDDIAGICSIYPPAGAISGCDSTPRHGFSAYCSGDAATSPSSLVPCAPDAGGSGLLCSNGVAPVESSGSGCATFGGGDPSRAPQGGGLLALGALLLVKRLSRRRRRPA